MQSEIKIENRIIYENLSFEDYLKLPGTSFSTIKNEGKPPFKPTAKMNLGSQVDDYLSHSHIFNGELEIVKPIASAVVNRVGLSLYTKLKKQISITADFVYKDMRLQWRGRLDYALHGIIVLDLKVAEDIDKTMFFFDYPNQLVGYSLGFDCTTALILSINPKTKLTKLKEIKMNYSWWQNQILKKGKPVWQ